METEAEKAQSGADAATFAEMKLHGFLCREGGGVS